MVEHNRRPAADRVHGLDRGARGRRLRASRPTDRATTIQTTVKPGVTADDLCAPATCSRCARATAACCAAPATPRRPWICAGSPGLQPVRRDQRADARRRHDDAPARDPRVRAHARAQGRHDRGSDRVPARARHVRARRCASAKLPTRMAEFTLHAFRDDLDGNEHVALVAGRRGRRRSPVLVRVHSRVPDRRRRSARCAATAARSSTRRSS